MRMSYFVLPTRSPTVQRSAEMRHQQLSAGLFGKISLHVRPCSLSDAQRLVIALHRHHGPVVGHKFSLQAYSTDTICRREEGAVIVGRPVSRHLDDGQTLEITRLVTSGTINVASMLLGAAARVARARGYQRLITYVLAHESGTSLRAAGFTCDGPSSGGSWSCPSRPRADKHPTGPKVRWSRSLRPTPSKT